MHAQPGPWRSMIVMLLTVLPALGVSSVSATSSLAQETSRTFPETGKTVVGKFLEYWDAHGGLAQQGYPISEQMQEVSGLDGKSYSVQYFERAVFELHTENQPPNDVLLSLLGVFQYKLKYPSGAPSQTASTAFQIDAHGFTTGEIVDRVYKDPSGQYYGGSRKVYGVDDQGRIETVTYQSYPGDLLGVYSATYTGRQSGHQSIAYFKVTAP